jgi:hypothetical protein
MNGIPRLSEAARRYRTNGYTDGREGREPQRVGTDYLDGYRVGRTFWGRTIIIEAAQAARGIK